MKNGHAGLYVLSVAESPCLRVASSRIVEAAHIVPWSESRDDLPTNGLCLCRLCHWSFDEGLMGVGERYDVLVSRSVRAEHNCLGHIQSLIGRGIILPADAVHHWSQDNLDWHRRHVYG